VGVENNVMRRLQWFVAYLCVCVMSLVEVGGNPATQPTSPVFYPDFDTSRSVFCYNANLGYAVDDEKREIDKRFRNPVLFVCHGTDVDGKWILLPDSGGPWDASKVAWKLAAKFHDRDIVMWVCNPGHHRIHVRRVWYFNDYVWSVPDDYAGDARYDHLKYQDDRETDRGRGFPGSIWEAVTDGN
jgi:hypothetical protein